APVLVALPFVQSMVSALLGVLNSEICILSSSTEALFSSRFHRNSRFRNSRFRVVCVSIGNVCSCIWQAYRIVTFCEYRMCPFGSTRIR
uniref:Secreted protein n=1 Tax=Macrostomum lignano TaxID=282301 RepID=A0A1I8FS28_9PLAT